LIEANGNITVFRICDIRNSFRYLQIEVKIQILGQFLFTWVQPDPIISISHLQLFRTGPIEKPQQTGPKLKESLFD